MKKFALACFVAAFSVLSTSSAHAGFLFLMSQVGNNVVVNGSGTLNTNSLTDGSNTTFVAQINPSAEALTVGMRGQDNPVSIYRGTFAGPSSFGTGGDMLPTFGSGDYVGFFGPSILFVPRGYVSVAYLSDTMTFNNATFSSLGITPGTYTYTWGSGANADSLVIMTVPEPSTWVALGLGALSVGIVALRRSPRFKGPVLEAA